MNVKIDTKEKFAVICPFESHLSANMTEELAQLLLSYLEKMPPHLVLNLQEVKGIDQEVAEKIVTVQQHFYEKNCSFVLCSLQPAVEKVFDENEWLELLNATPTESEAWDILQMEEVERELLGDFDEPDNT
jgi:anti-anti-sigma regulatory factor